VRRLLSFWRKKDGASAIEYGLLISMIALVAMVSLSANGVSLSNVFSKVSQAISADSGSSADNSGSGTSSGNTGSSDSNTSTPSKQVKTQLAPPPSK
jgi:Flp pilus assembly pilin Flp